MSRINGGALVDTCALDDDRYRRIMAAADLEREGVDLDSTHPAAPTLGALANALPDFYYAVILAEANADDWLRMAQALDHAARLCRQGNVARLAT